MTDTFPCFPPPSDKVVELATCEFEPAPFEDRTRYGHFIIRAIRLYRDEASATLLDGVVVRPTIRLAKDIVLALNKGMPALALAVEEGNYVCVDAADRIARACPPN